MSPAAVAAGANASDTLKFTKTGMRGGPHVSNAGFGAFKDAKVQVEPNGLAPATTAATDMVNFVLPLPALRCGVLVYRGFSARALAFPTTHKCQRPLLSLLQLRWLSSYRPKLDTKYELKCPRNVEHTRHK